MTYLNIILVIIPKQALTMGSDSWKRRAEPGYDFFWFVKSSSCWERLQELELARNATWRKSQSARCSQIPDVL